VTAPTGPELDGNPFVEWVDKYKYAPILFAEEVLGFTADESLDPEESDGQGDILRTYEGRLHALRDVIPTDGSAPNQEALDNIVRQISAVSGHGVGKTTALAIIIIHHACMFFPQRCVCTSATEKQLFNALAAEVKGWMKKLPGPVQELFNITTERITLKSNPDESYIAFQTSSKENTESLAGIHSQHVLLVIDEGSGVPDPVYEGASGSMSDYHALMFVTGNPVRSSGEFAESHKNPDTAHRWIRLHLDCRYSPRVSPTWIRDMADKYGEDSNAFRVRILGQFPLQDDEAFLSRDIVESAVTRDVELVPVPIRAWGVDCARFGRDKSALVMRTGNVIEDGGIYLWGGLDTMQVVGRVAALYNELPAYLQPTEINVDVIGIGAGVVDRLRELKLPVRGINVSETASLSGAYANLKTELWDRGKTWFTRRDCKIPNHKDLIDELCAPSYDFASSGKLALESKKAVRKRTQGRMSPDVADAFMLTFAGDAGVGIHGRSANVKRSIRRNLRGIV
jgi:hypothetical protein